MWSIIVETGRILNESAVYLLFGFALAGVLHVVLPRLQGINRMLAGTGTRSVVLAALLGAPLPLCSCSVIPAALTIRRQGASKGATASFLISVPETDVVSILLTYGLLGPVMAVFRPLAAVLTAVVTGTLINLIDRRPGDQATAEAQAPERDQPTDDKEHLPAKGAIRTALHYGFVEFFDDIIVSLLIGIVLGGAITALLPSLGIERLAGNSWLAMLAMLGIGIPMYVCATASTPIAAGLIVAGVSPGAVLVFLLAGPATNLASLIVLHKYLGRLTLIVYLACIAVISVLMGVCLDAIVASVSLAQLSEVPLRTESPPGAFKIGGSILMAGLSLLSLRRIKPLGRILRWAKRVTGPALAPK